jgi:hypothetical protein
VDHIFFVVAIIVALQFFWQRMAAPKVTAETEVERLAVLQQAAAARRAEYAAEKERVMLEKAPPSSSPPSSSLPSSSLPSSSLPSSSRRQVEEAEAAYAMALQAWENRQSRQKSC